MSFVSHLKHLKCILQIVKQIKRYSIPEASELANLSEDHEQDFVQDDDHDQEP